MSPDSKHELERAWARVNELETRLHRRNGPGVVDSIRKDFGGKVVMTVEGDESRVTVVLSPVDVLNLVSRLNTCAISAGRTHGI
jgi:hypothetical protein